MMLDAQSLIIGIALGAILVYGLLPKRKKESDTGRKGGEPDGVMIEKKTSGLTPKEKTEKTSEFTPKEGNGNSLSNLDKMTEDYHIIAEGNLLSNLNKMTEDYHIIAEYIGILNVIQDLGGFVAPYENFLEDVEEEIRILENRGIRGPEYFRRSHQLKFALNMALVYARVKGNWNMVPQIRSYLKRVEVL